MKTGKVVLAAAAVGAALGLALAVAGTAVGETGPNVTQDFMCMVPAYASMHDTDGKCVDVMNPTDYGSGPQEPEPEQP